MFTVAACFITGTLGFLLCALFTGGKVADLYDTIAARDDTIDQQAEFIRILRDTLNRTHSAEVIPLRRA